MKRDALRMRQRAVRATQDVADAPLTTRLDVPQPGQANFDQRVRETLMTYLGKQGNFLDRGITVRDLMDAGIITLPPGWTPGGGNGGVPPFLPGIPDDEIDLTPPPDVSGFVATPGITVVFVETDNPTFTAGHGYLRTNIYGAAFTPGVDAPPTFADAQPIFSFTGEIGSWATQPATTFALWAKWETRDGVESINPVGGTNGVQVTTGQDVAKLVEAMTGPGNPFKEVTSPITLPDGTVVPVGVYISDAYIHRMQVVNAMIHDLAVTNAKVADLSASKLTAGSINVGEYLQSTGYVPGSSGWIINGNGTAEFSNVTVRGAVYASSGTFTGTINAGAGTIGGSTIGATFMQSTNYIAGTQGWRLDSGGTGQIGGVVFDIDALRSNNYVAGTTGWRLTPAGTGQIGGLIINNNSLTSSNYGGGVGFRFNYDGTGQIGGFVVATNAIYANNWVSSGGTAGWYIGQDGVAYFSRIALYGVVYGSTYVPNNSTSTVVHGTGRYVAVTLWSGSGNCAMTNLDTNSFTMRLDNSAGGTVYYAYV